MAWTCCHTLTTQTTLVLVYVSHSPFNGYCSKRTLTGTLATTYARGIAHLHGSSSLVVVAARHIDTTVSYALVAQLKKMSRTGFHTRATTNANRTVDGRNAIFAYLDAVEATGRHAVATT